MSETVQYVNPNAVYQGGETFLQAIIPAYVYQEYADDDNIQALFSAYNQEATQFLLWFNTLNLPIYTGGIVSGLLLDWVGQGLYGMARPSLTYGAITSKKGINALPINTIAINGLEITSTETSAPVTDDIYRRMLTWNFYKSDGFVFSILWLKRRILRFLEGANGVSFAIDQTYSVSVTVSNGVFTIMAIGSPFVGATLVKLIQAGACITPFQYTFNITVSTGLENDGGLLVVYPSFGYPLTFTGLVAGQVWSNGGSVAVIPGITPNPSAPPVYFGSVSSLDLLNLGGGNLPLTNPGVGSLQLWNNGGAVCVA